MLSIEDKELSIFGFVVNWRHVKPENELLFWMKGQGQSNNSWLYSCYKSRNVTMWKAVLWKHFPCTRDKLYNRKATLEKYILAIEERWPMWEGFNKRECVKWVEGLHIGWDRKTLPVSARISKRGHRNRRFGLNHSISECFPRIHKNPMTSIMFDQIPWLGENFVTDIDFGRTS